MIFFLQKNLKLQGIHGTNNLYNFREKKSNYPSYKI
ncbi:hypothetical protein BvCmsHHNP007_04190 [Escherichia coli]|nr:hypothetical protein BvCmsHHNP007_04190 [Escherichia coli]GDC92153.1 hypothetical protein HmCmsJML193_01925 [Escherichia coli]